MAVKSNTAKSTGRKSGVSDEARVATNITTMVAASNDAAIAAGGMPARPSLEYYAAWEKCRALGKQLSQALAETGDNEFAYVRPAGVEYTVFFGSMGDDHKSLVELPVQKVDRLAVQLAFALDDWHADGAPEFIAHVHPASSGRGVSYLTSARETKERESLLALIDEHKAVNQAFKDLLHLHDDDSPEFAAKGGPDLSSREVEILNAVVDYPTSSINNIILKGRYLAALQAAGDLGFEQAEAFVKTFGINASEVQA